jgi:hypothetical protein
MIADRISASSRASGPVARHAALVLLVVLCSWQALAPLRAQPPDAPVESAIIDRAIKPDHPIEWPTRLRLAGQRDSEMGVVIELPPSDGKGYVQRQVITRNIASEEERTLVRSAPDGPWEIDLEGSGSVIYVPALLPSKATNSKASSPAVPTRVLEFVSARAAEPNDLETKHALIERTWFSYDDPIGEAPPKGLVLLMPGIFGEPRGVIERLVESLRAHSWAVLRMNAQSSRFTETVILPIDTEHPASSIATINQTLTQRVAECAYAVQAATSWCERARPALAALPRQAIGMSGGAMTLPCVLARDPERYSGAIIIAGGAEFLSLTDRSVYKNMIHAIDFAWSRDPTDAERRAISEAYLRAAPLDSYHTAAMLRAKRLLMIHGTLDMAVPATNGDLLWDRLGRPERWSIDGGHEQVFMWCSRHLPGIVDWVDGKNERPDDVK